MIRENVAYRKKYRDEVKRTLLPRSTWQSCSQQSGVQPLLSDKNTSRRQPHFTSGISCRTGGSPLQIMAELKK